MPILGRAAKAMLFATTLALGGCFLDLDGDDDETTGEGAVVVDSDDVVACRTECDNDRTQCAVSCNDAACTAVCDEDQRECVTDCD